MALHSDQMTANAMVGENILLAFDAGLLTDQNVIDATNVADLKASIDTNAAGKHADSRNVAYQIKRALDIGKDDGTLSDAAVAAATGAANLASLTLAGGKIGPLSE